MSPWIAWAMSAWMGAEALDSLLRGQWVLALMLTALSILNGRIAIGRWKEQADATGNQ